MPILIHPEDEANHTLIQNVHPPDWINPEPAGRYNLVVIGAGTAGLVTAAIAAGLGAKTALIEKDLMGGDCLNIGCVPSKAVLRASRAWADARRSEEFGVSLPEGARFDFGAVMTRMRQLRSRISSNDSAHRFKKMGVDLFFGEGRFIGRGAVKVGDRTLRFSRAAICTGARAILPPIPGLREAGSLTNETVFNLTELPRRLAVIGAGPIGCELAQAFARFGSRVTVIERMARILPREDPDAAAILKERMQKEGVVFQLEASVKRVEVRGVEKVIRYETGGAASEWVGEAILIGIGRAPHVEGLGLEEAGVAYNPSVGVKVDKRLQTTNPRIYAAGDICFPYKFTHAADALAQILIQNALFPHPLGLGYAGTDSLIIPWCTYTQPEIAHVGMTEAEAGAKGIAVDSFTYRLDEVDRAILDGEEEGFVRLHVQRGTDRILGATIVAAHAGEMISEITVVMKAGAGLKTVAGTIHPYPTQSEAIKKAAIAWRKSSFTEGKRKILRRWFSWRR